MEDMAGAGSPDFGITDEINYASAPRGVPFLSKAFPALCFYPRMLYYVFRASRRARLGVFDDAKWSEDSAGVLGAVESVGINVEVRGLRNLDTFDGPCVILANHMSTLETLVLPGLILPHKRLTFVVKKGLVEYPVFKHIMRSRDPVVVGRENPREDLKAVLDGGARRLGEGISIVIFPQTTRSVSFDSAEFNSIGVKLARKAGVPVVPLALKTDAWGNGRLIKDFGRIDPKKAVRFRFGPPMMVKARGAEELDATVSFIEESLSLWGGGAEGASSMIKSRQ